MGQEDALDRAEYEKWQFNDRIEWIEVRMQLIGPQKVYQEIVSVTVPEYKRYFFNMISGLLGISVIFVYLLPYALIIGAIVWSGTLLIRRFRKKLGKPGDEKAESRK